MLIHGIAQHRPDYSTPMGPSRDHRIEPWLTPHCHCTPPHLQVGCCGVVPVGVPCLCLTQAWVVCGVEVATPFCQSWCQSGECGAGPRPARAGVVVAGGDDALCSVEQLFVPTDTSFFLPPLHTTLLCPFSLVNVQPLTSVMGLLRVEGTAAPEVKFLDRC